MSQMLIKSPVNTAPSLTYYASDIKPEAGLSFGFIEVQFYPASPGDGGFDFSYFVGDEPTSQWLIYQRFTEVEHTGNDQIWVKAEITGVESGFQSGGVYGLQWKQGGAIGVWVDLWDNWELEIYDAVFNGIPEVITIDLSIAKDDGGGAPDTATTVVYPMRMETYRGLRDYQIQDEFSGAGTLANHIPNTDQRQQGAGDTPQWVDAFDADADFDHNHFGIVINNAEIVDAANTFTDALSVIDAQVTDFQVCTDINFESGTVAGGLVGRLQDSLNFWLLAVKNPLSSDPVLGLYKVASGVHTLEASLTMTGLGPFDSPTNWRAFRLSFDGNDILGECDVTESGGVARQRLAVTLTDAAYNTETRAGIWGSDVGAGFRRLSLYEWPVGFNPIVFDTSPVTSSVIEPSGVAYNPIFFYNSWNGKIDFPYHSSFCYYVDKDTVAFGDVIDHKVTDFVQGVFLVKWEPVSGDTGQIQLNYLLGQSGVWVDLFNTPINLDAPVLESYSAVIDVTVAIDDGAGSPYAPLTYNVTKRITMVSQSLGT